MPGSRRIRGQLPAHVGMAWISPVSARQLRVSDFSDFDWLLCADEQNLRDVLRLSPPALRSKVALLMEWVGVEAEAAIPDPYTGGPREFEQVWQLVDSAAQAVVARLCKGRDCGIIRDIDEH